MKTPYIETDCTFTFQGRQFTADGAVVTDAWAIGYPKFSTKEYTGANGTLHDWHGHKIGECRIVAMWETPRSWVSSHMCQIQATINGRKYTGRGAGSGMFWRGKAIK